MREVMFLVLHLLTTVARLLGPGGGRTIVAENLLLKHQLLVCSRTRKREPNLSMRERTLFGFWTLFLNPRRITRAAIIVKPSTLLKFHTALTRRKYRVCGEFQFMQQCGSENNLGNEIATHSFRDSHIKVGGHGYMFSPERLLSRA